MGRCSVQTILQGDGYHSLPRAARRPFVICPRKRRGRVITDKRLQGKANRRYRQALTGCVSWMVDRGTSGEFIGFWLASISSSCVRCWTEIFPEEQRIANAGIATIPGTSAIESVPRDIGQYPWHVYEIAGKQHTRLEGAVQIRVEDSKILEPVRNRGCFSDTNPTDILVPRQQTAR